MLGRARDAVGRGAARVVSAEGRPEFRQDLAGPKLRSATAGDLCLRARMISVKNVIVWIAPDEIYRDKAPYDRQCRRINSYS